MAFAATNIWEVQTGGHDANNGGGFNPGNTSMATDLEVTGSTGLGTSVTVQSASYSFISRDIGHWIFIKSGTSWTPGWYKITGVAAGVATIDAAVGHVPLYSAIYKAVYDLNTAAGCATVASPTGGTWSIDYSQSTPISFTDLAAPTTTTFTSAANPIGKNFVGNIFSITSGTGWNVVRWECVSTSGTTGTAGNFSSGTTIATALSTGGTGNCGGPLVSPGQASGLMINGHSVYFAAGTYTISSASSNVAGGIVSNTAGGGGTNYFSIWEGYSTYRGDKPGAGSRPVIHAGSGVISSAVMWTIGGNHTRVRNLSFNGNSQTSVTGLQASGNRQTIISCDALNCTTRGLYASASAIFIACSATGCSGTAAIHSVTSGAVFCEAYANTCTGMLLQGTATGNLSYGNTGASSDGFLGVSYGQVWVGCVAYGNGRAGFRPAAEQNQYINCIAEGNTGHGFGTTNTFSGYLQNCGVYNNGTNIDVNFLDRGNVITGTGSFFTNAAAHDFSLNNTPGAGAALREIGFPTTWPRGLTANFSDIGASQSQSSGGTAGYSRARTVR